MIDGFTIRIVFAVVTSQILISAIYFQVKNPEIKGVQQYSFHALFLCLMFTLTAIFTNSLPHLGAILNNIFFVFVSYYYCRSFLELLEIRSYLKFERIWFYIAIIISTVITVIDISRTIRVPFIELIVALIPYSYLLYMIRKKVRLSNLPKEINFFTYSLFILIIAHFAYMNSLTFSSYPSSYLNNQIRNISLICIMFAHLSSTIAFLMLVSGLKESKLVNLSNTDSLTGLLNRRAFFEIVESLPSNTSHYFIMFDADFFKKINDKFGHIVGDKALQHISQTLKSCLSENDVVARYGGEEFIAVISNCTVENVDSIAERIRLEIIKNKFYIDNIHVPITLSIGVAKYQDSDPLIDIDKADQMLYKAKKNGRNMVCIYSH
ncbi:GGDEF domain-containing protein [Colwellia sp. TT2012]|uniref:GGDEF domain-containing protein n=1 Tax=Colwellia sp. TT2012 TaxID=1720342 RepID=UPI00070ADF42|nr:GGDEF domain-containing protein [Colwellia sp. TT2012]